MITLDDITTIHACSPEDNETLINIDKDMCTLYTTQNTMLTKMKHLIKDFPDNYVCIEKTVNCRTGEPTSYTFTFPVNLLTFRGKKKEISEEHKQKLAARMRSVKLGRGD